MIESYRLARLRTKGEVIGLCSRYIDGGPFLELMEEDYAVGRWRAFCLIIGGL